MKFDRDLKSGMFFSCGEDGELYFEMPKRFISDMLFQFDDTEQAEHVRDCLNAALDKAMGAKP